MIWSYAICCFLFLYLGNEKNQPGKVNILAWKILSQKWRCLFILISHWTKHPPFVKCLSVSSDVDVLWCEIKNMLCLLFLHFELHPPLLNNGQKCRPFFANMPTNRLTDNWQLFLFQISHFLFKIYFYFLDFFNAHKYGKYARHVHLSKLSPLVSLDLFSSASFSTSLLTSCWHAWDFALQGCWLLTCLAVSHLPFQDHRMRQASSRRSNHWMTSSTCEGNFWKEARSPGKFRFLGIEPLIQYWLTMYPPKQIDVVV